MKHLLQAHGIKVTNNQIAKADVEKAIKIMAVAGKYDKLSEKEKLELVKEDWFNIRFIKDQSEAVQLAAVKQSGEAMEYIKDPSEAVQLVAIKNNIGDAFYYIKNPSEEIQLVAVKKHGCNIKYIKDPSEAVQLAAARSLKKVDIDYEIIGALKKIKNPIKEIKDLINGKFDITSIWDMFPPEFRKKFKNLVISGDNLIIQYKKLFDGDEEKYAQFLEFSYKNGKVEVGMSTIGEDSGTDGLGETFGTYDLKDKDFVKKVMKEVEENFGS